MKTQKTFTKRWAESTPLARTVTVLHLMLCTAVLVMAILRLCAVISSMTLVFFPMGAMLLSQSFLHRKEHKRTATVILICGVVVLVCSTGILILELLGV